MSIGPIQAFVIGFPDNDLFEGRIAEELGRLSDVGQIRIVDAVFVLREGDDVAALSVSDLDDDQRAELRSAVAALVGLGVGGEEGAVAGAELGASADADAPTRRGVGRGGTARRAARWQLGARARDRASLGDPAARCRPGCRRPGARTPLAHCRGPGRTRDGHRRGRSRPSWRLPRRRRATTNEPDDTHVQRFADRSEPASRDLTRASLAEKGASVVDYTERLRRLAINDARLAEDAVRRSRGRAPPSSIRRRWRWSASPRWSRSVARCRPTAPRPTPR